MADEAPTDVPILAGERFSTITDDDHGGIIYITVFLALIYSILTLGARVGIKWSMLGADDWTMGAAQVRRLRGRRGELRLIRLYSGGRIESIRGSTRRIIAWPWEVDFDG